MQNDKWLDLLLYQNKVNLDSKNKKSKTWQNMFNLFAKCKWLEYYCIKILAVWIPPVRVKMDTWNIWILQTHINNLWEMSKNRTHMNHTSTYEEKKHTHIWSYEQTNRKHLDMHLNLTNTWNIYVKHLKWTHMNLKSAGVHARTRTHG